MYTNFEQDPFLSPESIISDIVAAQELSDPGIDFEEDAAPADWSDAPAYE